ncbi:MAG: DegT/DnrJ/EryC1/StrS family aminotransferase [Planctomycetes bacterium]|nr:DegT/DnrJ/EryC1/StrS family aminotransferase [Planctomycetota bacterium]
MWVRLQLDFSWWDFAFGMSRLCQPHDEIALKNAIERRFAPDGNAITVLSVRSGFDLLLGAMHWPIGSEIVFSAFNIPDMTMVARENGIVPVPADLDFERLAPDLDAIERAITPSTKAILVAHLYGNFVPLEPILAIARRHGLMLIEDCAENYDGVHHGHPGADVSLFSFGPLKTATSLAGGVLRARDSELMQRLRVIHDGWPRQSRLDFFNRLCKYGTMKFFGARWIYPTLRSLARIAVGDVDQLIHHSAKSFRADEIMSRLRQQPCGPLLESMARRLARFDHGRIAARIAHGKLLTRLLRGEVVCPGAGAESHNYWLYPVLVADPDKTIAALAEAGFDATRAESMRGIDPPADRPELDPVRVKDALAHLVLVPCYPEIPESDLRHMAEVLIRTERAASTTEAMRVTVEPFDTACGEAVGRHDATPPAVNAENAARR